MYSALNLINDYATVGDAGTLDITRAKGVITSIFEYNDHIIIWTEFGMHELYGTGPATFEVVDIEGEVGCISDRSVSVCNQKLYWVWYDGVYEYNGGSPKRISQNVEKYFRKDLTTTYMNTTYKADIVTGAIGDYLYVSLPSGTATANDTLLVYDTKTGIWHIEDAAITDFTTIGNTLYGVATDGTIYNMRSGTDDDGAAISWDFTTKAFNDGGVRSKKTLTDLWMVVDLPTDSTLSVYYSDTVDSTTDFVLLYTFTADSDEQNTRLQIPSTALQNVDWYRFKFVGTGPCTIHSMEKTFRVKQR
jgi:hypothetical protein